MILKKLTVLASLFSLPLLNWGEDYAYLKWKKQVKYMVNVFSANTNDSIFPGFYLHFYSFKKDINADGIPDKILIFSKIIYKYTWKGKFFLETLVTPVTYIFAIDGKSKSTIWKFKKAGDVIVQPKIQDINGDGRKELIFALLKYRVKNAQFNSTGTSIFALNTQEGNILWKFNTKNDMFCSPVIADIDKDNVSEIVFTAKNLYVVNGKNGKLKWKYNSHRYLYTSPLIGDMESNGRTDILVCDDEGYFYIFEVNGKLQK